MQYAETYTQWKSVTPAKAARAWARARALDLLYARLRATGALQTALETPRIQFTCFHYIFRDEETSFRRMMERLSRAHTFIPWSRGVEMVLRGETPDRPYLCFSSDDGFESNRAFSRILGEFGASACFFLNPATLGETDDVRGATFTRLRHESNPVRFLGWNEVDDLLAAGHEVGNHTMTHVVCSETPSKRIADEILETKAIFEARFGPIRHFAWPYGQYSHFSEEARRLVFDSGHVSAASVVRGCHLATVPHDDPSAISIRRDQVWASEPLRHLLYFLAHHAMDPAAQDDFFPTLAEGCDDVDGVAIARGANGPCGLSRWDAIPWPTHVPGLAGAFRENAPAAAPVRSPSPRRSRRIQPGVRRTSR